MKEPIGDPMELAALKAVKWHMITPSLVQSKKRVPGKKIQIIRKFFFLIQIGGLYIEHRYFFTSALARMSVIVSHTNESALKGKITLLFFRILS